MYELAYLGGLTLSVVEVRGAGDDGILDRLAQVGLGGLLHLLQNHSADFLGRVDLVLALDLHLNERLAIFVHDLVGVELGVTLDLRIVPAATNQTLHIKNLNNPITIGKYSCVIPPIRDRARDIRCSQG